MLLGSVYLEGMLGELCATKVFSLQFPVFRATTGPLGIGAGLKFRPWAASAPESRLKAELRADRSNAPPTEYWTLNTDLHGTTPPSLFRRRR